MNIPLPGPARMTLLLLVAVPALMAYPWSSTRERWVLAVGLLVLVALLAWWRGLHLSTIARRWLAMSRSGGGLHTDQRSGSDAHATAVLRVAPSDTGALPVALITGYLNRYGLQADAVRVTSRDGRSDTGEALRDIWIGLTYSAARNLAALQARSASIPLQETADVAVRRLADHLREIGWETALVGSDDLPELVAGSARETWRTLVDSSAGSTSYVAAYRVGVDDALSDTLAEIRGYGARETWTAVEVADDGHDHRTVAAACALRTSEPPHGGAPLPELVPQQGSHRSAVLVLDPLSGRLLDGHTPMSDVAIEGLRWPTMRAAATRT
ncbi:MAG: type VII secretion protein EccE [Mycobacterium sp.]